MPNIVIEPKADGSDVFGAFDVPFVVEVVLAVVEAVDLETFV